MSIRVATYNVENLFDHFTRDGSAEPKEERERQALAKVLKRLDADVIALQEVENLNALLEVNQILDSSGYPYVYHRKGNSTRGIHTAFLSRKRLEITSRPKTELFKADGRPLMGWQTIKSRERGLPETQLLIQRNILVGSWKIAEGRSTHIVNLHLKSQLDYWWMGQAADTVRAGEARAVSDFVGRMMVDRPDDLIFIVGDFNAENDEPSIRPLLDMPGFVDLVELEWKGYPRYSYHPKTYRGRIDYVLGSEHGMRAYKAGSIAIYGKKTAKRASDHFPIYFDLDL